MLGPKPIQDWQNVGTPPWGYRSIVPFDFQTQWIVTNTSVLHTVTHFTSRHFFLRRAVRINELIFSSFGFPLFDISPSFTPSIRQWITRVKYMHWNILLHRITLFLRVGIKKQREKSQGPIWYVQLIASFLASPGARFFFIIFQLKKPRSYLYFEWKNMYHSFSTFSTYFRHFYL